MAFNLESITADAQIAPPRMVIYGPHGVGKTTFASNAPTPILLPFEDGIGKLSIARFPLIKTWDQAMEACGALIQESHPYQTAAIDSLDWLEPIIWAETCRRNGWKDIEQPGFGKGYVAAADVWRDFFDCLVAMRDTKGMSVILLAHCEAKRFEDPTSDPYDRYGIKLQPRAGAIAQEWADMVGFANFKTYTQKADAGFNRKVTRGVGLGERVLFTEERPAFYAKNRYGLPPEMPFSYEALSAALFPTTA